MKKTSRKNIKNQSNFDYEDAIMGMEAGGIDTHDGILARDVRLKRLVEYIDVPRGTILDIGCGGGTITNFLANTYPNTRVFGCDISKKAISVAKKNAPKRAAFGVIVNGRFPYKDKFFDACICFDVLEHVPDADLFLSETKRVLKKGGLIYFAIPCEGQPWSLTWFLQKLHFGDKLTYKHVGHIHPEFTHSYIRGLFKKHGFRIQSVTYSEHFLTQCIRFIRFIIPKELLEFVMGTSSAQRYYDRALVGQGRGRPPSGVIAWVRKLWLKFGVVFDTIENAESHLLKQRAFTAWKMLVLARTSR